MGYSASLSGQNAGPVTAAERLVFLLRKASPRKLITIACIMLPVTLLINFGSILLVAFGHICAVMRVVKSGALRAAVDRFAAVGRMALSNYLSHSLVMTTLFYGLGLYAEIPRFGQQGFVVALIALQLLFSPWWLKHFRFGPAEWLWRSLTYGQRQPMRR